MDIETLRSHKQEILAIAHQYGARNIRVFGSVAHGNTHEASDIDLLVDIQEGHSLLDFARLKIRLEDLLGQEVDLVEAASVKSHLRDFINEDSIPL